MLCPLLSRISIPVFERLKDFGGSVSKLFGGEAFIVGSCLVRNDWKDVDVRVIMPDDMWAAFVLGCPNERRSNPRWLYFCREYSNYGKAMTGLPIDFQIQQKSWADARFEGPRWRLGGL